MSTAECLGRRNGVLWGAGPQVRLPWAGGCHGESCLVRLCSAPQACSRVGKQSLLSPLSLHFLPLFLPRTIPSMRRKEIPLEAEVPPDFLWLSWLF